MDATMRREADITKFEEDRFSLYRLCECPECAGTGRDQFNRSTRCPECRGEGRVRQELASCATPEAVGVAIVTLGREGEWSECAFGLLDREGAVNEKWLVLPWLPSPRNVRDAARTLARSKGKPQTDR